jgi:hypothetical protein
VIDPLKEIDFNTLGLLLGLFLMDESATPADENRRYFYQLEGEGIRYEIVAFAKSIQQKKNHAYVDESVTRQISSLMERYYAGENVTLLYV